MTKKCSLYSILELFLILMAVAVVCSNTLMTIADVCLFLVWLAFGYEESVDKANRNNGVLYHIGHGFIIQINKFLHNKAAIIFSLFYLASVVGIIYSSNIDKAVNDLIVKLPLLLFSVLFSGFPLLNKETINKIFIFHCAMLLIASLIGVYNLFVLSINYRKIFPYISHIRLSLNYCVSVLFLFYYIFKNNHRQIIYKIIPVIIIIWFIMFLIIMKSMTGIGSLIAITVLILTSRNFLESLSKKQRICVISIFSVIIIFVIGFFVYSYVKYYKSDFGNREIAEYTLNGNKYSHKVQNGLIEEGDNYMYNVCLPELRKEWSKRSELNFDSSTYAGTPLKITLIRFLNSMDLPKDSVGVSKLSQKQIGYIEQGIANINYLSKFGLYSRMSSFFFSCEKYKKEKVTSGNSVLQRFSFWKAGIMLFKKHPVFGVGTGDVDEELNIVYETNFPRLSEKYRFSTHNQFINIACQLGVVGLLIFLASLLIPGILLHVYNDFHWKYFLLLMIISMFFEDTIGTQAGVTLFSYFYFIFLFNHNYYANQRIEDHLLRN